MTVLIEMTSRDPDVFYWTKPGTHGMPVEYAKVRGEIEILIARYIRLCDVEPLPWAELEELDDQIKQLEKIKAKVYEQVMKGAYCEQI
jgi:hypothetical protein